VEILKLLSMTGLQEMDLPDILLVWRTQAHLPHPSVILEFLPIAVSSGG